MTISIKRAKTFRTRKNFPESNACALWGFLGLCCLPLPTAIASNSMVLPLLHNVGQRQCSVLGCMSWSWFNWKFLSNPINIDRISYRWGFGISNTLILNIWRGENSKHRPIFEQKNSFGCHNIWRCLACTKSQGYKSEHIFIYSFRWADGKKKLKKEGVVLRRVTTLLGEIWSGSFMGKRL